MAESSTKNITIQQVFREYAKFGKAKDDGNQISLSNSDKWMKEAKIIDGKKVTTTDTGILFSKFKAKTLDLKQYMEYLEALAKEKKLNLDEVKAKLIKCSVPGTSHATKADDSKVVSRMTDTSKYTGSHKDRFDDSGKGKGIQGREDADANDGYVQGYKHKDTYDKK